MQKTIISTLLFFIFLNLNAQNDRKFVHTLIHDAFKLKSNNLDSANILLVKAKKIIDLNKIDQELGYYYQVSSTLARQINALKKSDSLINLSYKYCVRDGDSQGISIVYLEKGNRYLQSGDLDSSLFYSLKSLAIKEKLHDEEGIAIANNNIGAVYDYKGQYQNAMTHYIRSMTLNEKLGNQENLGEAYHNISIIQYNLGNLTEAINYQNKAVAINKKLKNIYNEAMNYVCLSSFFLEKGANKEALQFGTEANKIANKINNHAVKLYSLSALGDVAKKEKDYQKAMDYFNLDHLGRP
ncbi:MAG: hypothetical protein RLZZ546_2925 [Bacteroidota bacterium]|jgi:tetratricopeptide (TPR) repeat protein